MNKYDLLIRNHNRDKKIYTVIYEYCLGKPNDGYWNVIKYILERFNFKVSIYNHQYFKALRRNLFLFSYTAHFDTYRIGFDVIYCHENYRWRGGVNLQTVLEYEFNVKVRKQFKLREPRRTSIVSASDISSYLFCPVSLAIKDTFIVHKNRATVYGEDHHSKSILSMLEGHKKANRAMLKGLELELFKDVTSSTVLFKDNNSKAIKPFTSKNKNYVGKPDYILKNEKGEVFVIEEKFIFGDSYIKSPYLNHKAQLESYILGIDMYDIAYGYLVYWSVSYGNEDELVYFPADLVKANRSECNRKLLNKTFKNIRHLRNKNTQHVVNLRINPRKCAACSVNVFCNHKYCSETSIEYPYSLVA